MQLHFYIGDLVIWLVDEIVPRREIELYSLPRECRRMVVMLALMRPARLQWNEEMRKKKNICLDWMQDAMPVEIIKLFNYVHRQRCSLDRAAGDCGRGRRVVRRRRKSLLTINWIVPDSGEANQLGRRTCLDDAQFNSMCGISPRRERNATLYAILAVCSWPILQPH